jgi:hypothetical protein
MTTISSQAILRAEKSRKICEEDTVQKAITFSSQAILAAEREPFWKFW